MKTLTSTYGFSSASLEQLASALGDKEERKLNNYQKHLKQNDTTQMPLPVSLLLNIIFPQIKLASQVICCSRLHIMQCYALYQGRSSTLENVLQNNLGETSNATSGTRGSMWVYLFMVNANHFSQYLNTSKNNIFC